MASMVAENREHVDDDYSGSENFELSPRNHNFLMSLLDETQIDDCDDDERLTKVIQSLQAELDCADHYASWEKDLMECQSSVDESCGQGCPLIAMAQNDHDLLSMDFEIMPTSPSGEVDRHGQGMNEYGWMKNNFSPIEADQDYGYSLWHGTHTSFD